MKYSFLALSLTVALVGSFSYAEDFKSVSETIKHYKSQMVNLQDLDEDARQDFVESYPGKEPGIVRADFNGDGKEDVAVLTKAALLFFICKEQCKEFQSQNYGGFAGFQYIIPIKKGVLVEEFGGFDSGQPTPPVRLKNTAVHLIFYGKASIAYYWDSKLKIFGNITTGD
jgi:hypothetical protein